MAKVYVEPRPKGRDGDTPIDHFVVEDSADSELHRSNTQQDAIEWAEHQNHGPVMVARVRHLTNKKIPDHWRAV